MRASQLLLLFVLTLSLPAAALENRLKDNPSPYLAMHGNDPVAWQPWSRAALELAKKKGRLLFISSGYFACHWCHVMQRESYSNPAIAELLNQYFIPVKVDRELNPALDEHLIDFVQRTQGQAGWPLNVFLTPDGYPIVGVTYVPPGQFRQLLGKLQKLWLADTEGLNDLARRGLLALMETRKVSAVEKLLSAELLRKRFVAAAMTLADDLQGGFGQQNRFPMAPQLQVLLEIQARHPNPALASFLKLTLGQMAEKGLRDHLGGGFFRYTVDPGWLVPHYEKMLYTQALLAQLYLRAADVFREEAYREVARDTLKFVVREMRTADGAYVTSFSAVDDTGAEGGYYLWREAQLKEALSGDLLQLAQRHWQLVGFESGPDGVLPLPGESPEVLARLMNKPLSAIRQLLEQARNKLLAAREKRKLPVDGKQLAGWNGLMLAALVEGSEKLRDNQLREAARSLRDYLIGTLWDGRQLYRAVHDGQPIGQATLEDYAYVALGLQRWAQATGSSEDARMAEQLLLLAWQNYYDGSGWRSISDATLPGMPSVQAQEDGALPSAAALIMLLSQQSKEPALQHKVAAAAPASQAVLQENPFWYASHVQLLMAREKR